MDDRSASARLLDAYLVASARVESSDAQLADYYHMFKFEGDPVFEPYTGGTMQDCGLANHDRSLPRSDPGGRFPVETLSS